MENNEGHFLDWFAGFVAGEGCFCIQSYQPNGHWRAELFVALRDDDLPILIEIQERLQMGRVYRRLKKEPSNPAAQWTVTQIADCVRLVEIFHAHPIRAKKQADFEIWKEAVEIIREGGSKGGRNRTSYNRSKLQYLHDRLRLIRSYQSPGKYQEVAEEFAGEDILQLPIWETEDDSTLRTDMV